MLVLVAGALLAPLLARRREVLLATGATVACTLVWMYAPYTGYPRGPVFDSLAVGAVRYLLPTLAPPPWPWPLPPAIAALPVWPRSP